MSAYRGFLDAWPPVGPVYAALQGRELDINTIIGTTIKVTAKATQSDQWKGANMDQPLLSRVLDCRKIKKGISLHDKPRYYCCVVRFCILAKNRPGGSQARAHLD